MEIAGTSNAASAYAPSSLGQGLVASSSAAKSANSSSSATSQPIDQFTPGTRHRPKKGKGNYKKPRVRPPPSNKLDQEQLQAHHALLKRLDQERMASAIRKTQMYLPGAPMPLPALAAAKLATPTSPPIEASAPLATEAPVTSAAETTAQSAATGAVAQNPPVVNVGPGQLDITAEMQPKPSTESSGILGTALGVGLAASELTAYIARDSLNPLVGAKIIGEAAVNAAPAVLDGALWAAPKVVDGAAWLGPKAVDTVVTRGPQAVDAALWLGPKIVEGTTDFIANAPGYLQTGVNGLQTAGDAVVNAAQVSTNAVVEATPVAIQGAQDFATFVQNFQLPSGSTPTDSSPFTLSNIASDPGGAVVAAVTNPAAAGVAVADALGTTPVVLAQGTQDVATSVGSALGL